eukprot:365139-Chlamydomonas_euryale.AAC.13
MSLSAFTAAPTRHSSTLCPRPCLSITRKGARHDGGSSCRPWLSRLVMTPTKYTHTSSTSSPYSRMAVTCAMPMRTEDLKLQKALWVGRLWRGGLVRTSRE